MIGMVRVRVSLPGHIAADFVDGREEQRQESADTAIAKIQRERHRCDEVAFPAEWMDHAAEVVGAEPGLVKALLGELGHRDVQSLTSQSSTVTMSRPLADSTRTEGSKRGEMNSLG